MAWGIYIFYTIMKHTRQYFSEPFAIFENFIPKKPFYYLPPSLLPTFNSVSLCLSLYACKKKIQGSLLCVYHDYSIQILKSNV